MPACGAALTTDSKMGRAGRLRSDHSVRQQGGALETTAGALERPVPQPATLSDNDGVEHATAGTEAPNNTDQSQ